MYLSYMVGDIGTTPEWNIGTAPLVLVGWVAALPHPRRGANTLKDAMAVQKLRGYRPSRPLQVAAPTADCGGYRRTRLA
jgi:hypothetical protein